MATIEFNNSLVAIFCIMCKLGYAKAKWKTNQGLTFLSVSLRARKDLCLLFFSANVVNYIYHVLGKQTKVNIFGDCIYYHNCYLCRRVFSFFQQRTNLYR